MGQDRTFLCNFLLLLFFYRLSFSKQASNDLLRCMLLSVSFSKGGAKLLLFCGSIVVVFTTFNNAVQLFVGFARQRDKTDTLLLRRRP